MKLRFLAPAIAGFFILASAAFGQGYRYDNIALLDTGRPANSATIRVCSSGSTGTPCNPIASIFTDSGLTAVLSNPFTSDTLGNYGFYAACNKYDIQISGSGLTTRTMKDVQLGPCNKGPGNISAQNQILNAFGDSITFGSGASVSANAYINLFAAFKGWTVNNQAHFGDSVLDQGTKIYTTFITPGMISSYLIGENDGANAGSSVYLPFLEADYAYLLTPNKTPAQSGNVTRTGTWTNSLFFTGIGLASSVNGSTVSMGTLTGSTIYIGFTANASNAATVKVTIDSVDYGPFLVQCPFAAPNSGQNWGPYLVRIPGLTNTQHSVTVTLVANNGGNVIVDWFAGNAGQSSNVLYALTMYGANNGESVYAGAANIVAQAAADMKADGLTVVLADIRGACTSSTGAYLCNGFDGVHPNDAGHAIMAGAMEKATQLFRDPNQPDFLNGYVESLTYLGSGQWGKATMSSGLNPLTDGGSITCDGQNHFGGDGTGFNQGSCSVNIGGSKYANQAATSTTSFNVWSNWAGGGRANVFSINGAGQSLPAGSIVPQNDGIQDLGTTTKRWGTWWGNALSFQESGDPAGNGAQAKVNANSTDHMLHFNPNAGGVQHVPQVYELTSQYTNSTTTFSTVGGFSFPIASGNNYTMTCHLYYQAVATGGLVIQFTETGFAPGAAVYSINEPLSASTFTTGTGSFGTGIGSAVTTAATNFDAVLSFSLVNPTGNGTVNLQAKSATAVQLQIQAGSYCVVQ